MSDAATQGDGSGLLEDWTTEVQEALDRLGELVPDLVPETFSHDSLAVLEEECVDAFTGETAGPDLIITAAAYLGETLMHTAGGHWDWHGGPREDGGVPLAVFDSALGLPPVRVLDLLDQALAEQTGTVFQGADDRLQQAVAAAQARDSSWRPVKVAEQYVDLVPEPVDDERLTAWLGERENGFPAWAGSTDDPAAWDFGVESLDALESLVEKRYDDASFRAAREDGDPFLQGAAWYLGEVCRRHRGGLWQYRAVRPGAAPGDWYSAHSGWTETPYVWLPLRQYGRALFPMGTLWALVAEEEFEGEFGHDTTLRRAIR